jgi:hypothetical protein
MATGSVPVTADIPLLRELPAPGAAVGKDQRWALSCPSGSKEGKDIAMKRIRMLVLVGVVAVALPLGVVFTGDAGATGSSGTSVSISQTADFDTYGLHLDVNLLVRCPPGDFALANVIVNQSNPETGVAATGDGFNPSVVCDGRTHSVGVTVTGAVYDPGMAYAIVDVGDAHVEKWITIKVN